jgi:hypothetical protein
LILPIMLPAAIPIMNLRPFGKFFSVVVRSQVSEKRLRDFPLLHEAIFPVSEGEIEPEIP